MTSSTSMASTATHASARAAVPTPTSAGGPSRRSERCPPYRSHSRAAGPPAAAHAATAHGAGSPIPAHAAAAAHAAVASAQAAPPEGTTA